MLPQLLNC